MITLALSFRVNLKFFRTSKGSCSCSRYDLKIAPENLLSPNSSKTFVEGAQIAFPPLFSNNKLAFFADSSEISIPKGIKLSEIFSNLAPDPPVSYTHLTLPTILRV